MEDAALLGLLISAINRDDDNVFKEVGNTSLQRVLKVKIAFGNTLIYEIIRRNRRIIFDCVLPCLSRDILENVNDFGDTVLAFTLKNKRVEYYAKQLIARGALYAESNLDKLLQLSVGKSLLHITKLLLDWGVDPNVEDQDGNTPLCIALLRGPLKEDDELICMLLVYGANPLVKCNTGHIPFELVYKKEYSSFAQELFFYYTFDELESNTIHFDILYNMMRNRRALFHKVIQNKIKCINTIFPEAEAVDMFVVFLYLDLENLKFLVEKCNSMICYISRLAIKYLTVVPNKTSVRCVASPCFLEYCGFCGLFSRCQMSLFQDQALTKLSVLIESSTTMKYLMVDFIILLSRRFVLRPTLLLSLVKDELQITHLLIYLIEHGFECDMNLLQSVYHTYGFCDLFKFLLHVEVKDSRSRTKPRAMFKLIYEVNTTVEQICSQPNEYQLDITLLDYFVHPKLREVLLIQFERDSENILEKIRNHPRIPLLQDLARNSTRRYLVQCFNVTCPKDFFSIVNKLPVSKIYKQIITLEKKLY